MSETSVVERLARKWEAEGMAWDEDAREDARWWMESIAEVLEAEGSTSVACNLTVADFLRTAAAVEDA